jgi:16S rRNA processing protein RimM
VTIVVRDLVAVGSIAKAFGIKGEVVVESLTDMPERFRSLQRVFLVPESVARGEENGEPEETTVTGVKVEQRGIRMRFTCAPGRTEAERLVGLLVMVAPEDAAPLPPGTFFVHQVIGFLAVDEQGAVKGTLKEVLRYPAHDVYVIAADGKPDLLIPAVGEFVKAIDPVARTVTVRVIEGMEQ